MSRRRADSEAPLSLFSFQDVITSISGIMILVVLMLVLDVLAAKATEVVAAAPAEDLEARVQTLRDDLKALTEQINSDQGVIDGIPHDLSPRDVEELRFANEQLGQLIAENRADLEDAEGTAQDAKGDKESLEAEIRRLTGQLKELKDKHGKLIEGMQRVEFAAPPGKETILVQCSDKAIEVKVLGKPPEMRSFPLPGGAQPGMVPADFARWARGRDVARAYFYVLVKPSSAPYAQAVINLLLGRAGDEPAFEVGYEPFEEHKTAVYEEEEAAP